MTCSTPGGFHDSAEGSRRHARAWLGLTAALALHVVDEASNDFLALYNPTVTSLRQQFPWLPLPRFTFGVWITGLAAAALLLAALTPAVRRGARRWVYLSFPFAGIMAVNGVGHLVWSLRLGYPVAGAWTSPLLLVGSGMLFWQALARSRTHG